MATRGIRGAITVAKNEKDAIVVATEMLLEKMVSVNKLKVDDIASVLFSVTHDLTKEFPAIAAREMGWLYTPLMCTNEIAIEGSLKKCIRVLMTVNSEKKQSEIKHVYLNEAQKLRPDLSSEKIDEYYVS
ncbi:MAG: chorismate mutase [Candidatus Saganbacteria bacterium]|nr:chorismate mutase [Candidatus Saganbacteria bacterium]